ncbi:MAG: amino acid adenylation domain-containing protein [Ruminococcaceae bacterium]|nr:amino acid adenylation domain-containing protein [Oscillospiraceae bacterium]
MINVLEYLENSAAKYPDKVAFTGTDTSVTFGQMLVNSRIIGSRLIEAGANKEPVVILMHRSPEMIVSFFGVIAAGCYYVPIDEQMPAHRTELIMDQLHARYVITDDVNNPAIPEDATVLCYNDIVSNTGENAICLDALATRRAHAIDKDPIYIVFTSGSTGVPKGVVTNHRCVIDYVEQLTKIIGAGHDSVFGMQSPLYVDACLKEIYSTLKFGATTHIVPTVLFTQPVKLVEFLNEHQVNTVCWVVPALTFISGLKTFKTIVPEYLKTVAFGSEVFPPKQLKVWRETLPEARFINLYGPTEATGMCCHYEVTDKTDPERPVPIGKPFPNKEIFLLNDDGKQVPDGEVGEICIRGISLAPGYFNNPEVTNKAFVQNPLNTLYPDIIYKTGDLGRYNQDGDLEFVSRKDFQIKHMGYRIELGEIEMLTCKVEGVENVCCLYDSEKKKISMFYMGTIDKGQLVSLLKEKLPRYMIPNTVIQLELMPLTAGGKTDRNALKQML